MKQISFQADVLPLKNELFRLAFRITLNREEAEDCVQEALIKVWNKRDRWQEIDSMEAFCLTICRNIAIDKTRRAANQDASLDDGYETPDRSHTANPEAYAEQQDRLALVRRLMDELPEKQRSAMHLREYEGKSYKEIAQVMGISEEQVKINIFRARKSLRKKYFENENYGL